MNKEKTLIFSLSAMLFLTASFLVYSWSEPEATMPGTYTPPINTSATAQTKSGDFSATSFIDSNDSNYYLNPSGNSVVSGTIVAGYPTESNELATKQYVEDALGGFIPPAGGEPGDTIVMGTNGPIWVTELSFNGSRGSMKDSNDCDQINGTPYDTGSGIICRYPGSAIPSGWAQAGNWQRYVGSATWGGDWCGRHKSSAPLNFENTAEYTLTQSSLLAEGCAGTTCGYHPDYWTSYDVFMIDTSMNVTTNRVEIGIY